MWHISCEMVCEIKIYQVKSHLILRQHGYKRILQILSLALSIKRYKYLSKAFNDRQQGY